MLHLCWRVLTAYGSFAVLCIVIKSVKHPLSDLGASHLYIPMCSTTFNSTSLVTDSLWVEPRRLRRIATLYKLSIIMLQARRFHSHNCSYKGGSRRKRCKSLQCNGSDSGFSFRPPSISSRRPSKHLVFSLCLILFLFQPQEALKFAISKRIGKLEATASPHHNNEALQCAIQWRHSHRSHA